MPDAPDPDRGRPPVLHYYSSRKTPRPPAWAPAYTGAIAISIGLHPVVFGLLILVAAPVIGEIHDRLAIVTLVYWITAVSVVLRRRFKPTRRGLLWVAFGMPALVFPAFVLELVVPVLLSKP